MYCRALLPALLLLLLAACSSRPNTPAGQTPAAENTLAPLPSPTVILVETDTPTAASSAAHTPTETATSQPTFTPTAAPTHPLTPTRARTNTPKPAAPTRPPATAPPPPPPPVAFQATELVSIPEGILKMGTPDGEQGDPDEKPQHDVTVYPFAIERFEVTNAQYQACVAARACPAPLRSNSFTRPRYFGEPAFARYPVLNVSWDGASAYCRWLGRRLPNEAEWERAARGVDNWRYTFTNILGMPFEWNAIYHGSPLSFCEASCPLQNYWGAVNDGYADTAPVGAFGYDSSLGFGVQDLAGNVSEWTWNWYDPNAYRDGNDVNGPPSPTGARVIRGGSWADEPRRNADRDSLAPNLASDRLGFRCAQ